MALGHECNPKNLTGWRPLDEAMANGHFQLTRMLLEHLEAATWQEFEDTKPALMRTLADMPDFSMKVRFKYSLVSPAAAMEYQLGS
jgi:ankyrin repeat protein